MSVVDAASIFPAAATAEDSRRLSDWALSRRSPEEQLVAIELVLAHEFDEQPSASPSGVSTERAESVRADYLLGVTGITADRQNPARSTSLGTEPQRPAVRVRGAAHERRAPHGRTGAAVR